MRLKKLYETRIKAKITSTALATHLGISNSFYSQIENGNRRLSYQMAIEIAKFFGKTPDELFYDDCKKYLKIN